LLKLNFKFNAASRNRNIDHTASQTNCCGRALLRLPGNKKVGLSIKTSSRKILVIPTFQYYSTPYEYNIVVETVYYIDGTWQPYYYFNLDMTTGQASALPASTLRSAPHTQAVSSGLMVIGCDQCKHDPCGLWPFWQYVVDPPTCPAPNTLPLPEHSAIPSISKDFPWAS